MLSYRSVIKGGKSEGNVLQWMGNATTCLWSCLLTLSIYRQDCWMFFEQSQHTIVTFNLSPFTLQLEVFFSRNGNNGCKHDCQTKPTCFPLCSNRL